MGRLRSMIWTTLLCAQSHLKCTGAQGGIRKIFGHLKIPFLATLHQGLRSSGCFFPRAHETQHPAKPAAEGTGRATPAARETSASLKHDYECKYIPKETDVRKYGAPEICIFGPNFGFLPLLAQGGGTGPGSWALFRERILADELKISHIFFCLCDCRNNSVLQVTSATASTEQTQVWPASASLPK